MKTTTTPTTDLVRVPDVCLLLGIGRTTLYGLLNDPDAGFPQPYRVSTRAIRFNRDEVLAWRESRRAGKPPAA